MPTKTKTAAKPKTPAKAKTATKPKVVTKAKASAKPKATVKATTPSKPKAAAKTPTKVKPTAEPKAAASARNVKKFNVPQSHDFTISDNSGVIGQVRIKPNAVAWKPKRGKAFHQLSLDQLAALAAEHGREVQN